MLFCQTGQGQSGLGDRIDLSQAYKCRILITLTNGEDRQIDVGFFMTR